RWALILTALTAPVAPACNANPTARTRMPGTKSTFEPSMSRPMRPSRYGGVLTAAPSAPVTALAASLSRRDAVGLTPMRRDGTATYETIITPITPLHDKANHGLPQRVTTMVDRPSRRPTTAPDPKTTARC